MKKRKMKNKPTQIWWVVDENEKCVDFFDHINYCSYIGRKIDMFKKKGYSAQSQIDGKTTLFTFKNDSVAKHIKLTEICD